MKYKVYFNLHKHLYSVQALGKVIATKEKLIIRFPSTTIYESMRQKVIFQKQKNVHAFLTCLPENCFDHFDLPDLPKREIYYSPYQTNQFVYKDTFEPIGSEVMFIELTIKDRKPIATAYVGHKSLLPF